MYEPHIIDQMTMEMAKRVRHLRCVEEDTWRAIAYEIFEDSNQLIGMRLCQKAEDMLGEDFDEKYRDKLDS